MRALGVLFAPQERFVVNPSAEIAAVQARIARHIERLRADHVIEADHLAALLHRYRSVHGTDTVASSLRPAPLRKAIGALVDAVRAIQARVPDAAPAMLVVEDASRMADLVLLRPRSSGPN